jgi:hypothetical protein
MIRCGYISMVGDFSCPTRVKRMSCKTCGMLISFGRHKSDWRLIGARTGHALHACARCSNHESRLLPWGAQSSEIGPCYIISAPDLYGVRRSLKFGADQSKKFKQPSRRKDLVQFGRMSHPPSQPSFDECRDAGPI